MRWFLLIIGCCLGWSTTAQTPPTRELKKSGLSFGAKYRYHEAYHDLAQYHEARPKDDQIWEALGIAAYHTHHLQVAEQLLRQVCDDNRIRTSNALLFLGKTYQLQQQFRLAANTYKQFLISTKSTHPLRNMVIDDIKRCGYGYRRSYPTADVLIENLGSSINDKWDDFAPTPSPIYQDRLYFSTVRNKNVGGRRDDAGLQDEENGFFRADIYSSDIVNGNWNVAQPLNALINSPKHDIILDFNKDGQVMYYFQGRDTYAGEVLVDTFKRPEARTLATTTLQSPLRTAAGDTAPFFYSDTMMIFASRRTGGYGGLDLYWSVQQEGVWQTAQNMGATVNSSYDETTPFLATDGTTLYFSSNHSQRSRGSFDIFKTVFDTEKGVWGVPQNMGCPINSAGDDRYFRLEKDGYRAFLTSNRITSMGGLDIFSIYFKNYRAEQRSSEQQVNFYDALAQIAEAEQTPPTTLPTYFITPLLFDNDQQLLNTGNQTILQSVAQLLQQYPDTRILITAHSDDSEPQRLDLLFSIKRAERIGLFLAANEIDKSRILIRGVGKQYPLAKNGATGIPKISGAKLNRRISLTMLHDDSTPAIQLITNYPEWPAAQTTFEHKRYQKLNEGLCYQVQVATSPQMYKGDLLVHYPHALVEKQLDEVNYQYLLGRYQKYQSAESLQQDFVRRGITSAQVVAYLDGQRLSVARAAAYLDRYADLANFIGGQTKE